jgi:shikimate dehydrogenase
MNESAGCCLYGLVGHPVAHSYSASMHQAAFRHIGMNAAYELFDVVPEQLDDFFKRVILERRLRGFNVTVPHKERAVGHLSGSISPIVRMNHAVNTVRVETDGALTGFNTDGPGFGRDLREKGFDPMGHRVCLVGAGGGAKAVATSLGSMGIRELVVFDADKTKAFGLADIVREFYPRVKVRVTATVEDMDISLSGLLVQATPVGMKQGDSVLVKKDQLKSSLFVYDLIYNPSQTPLLAMAAEIGCPHANGLGMLLHQGAIAFEHWTGQPAPLDVMRQALLEKLK